MATVDVLVTGSVHKTDLGDHVNPTICLVRSGDLSIVTDPGLLENPSVLTRALATHALEPSDVTHVFVTHHHIDHTRYVGMFPNATIVDGEYTYSGDLWSDHDGVSWSDSNEIRIIATPGHARNGASLVVEAGEFTYVITHEWWFSDMTPEDDPMAEAPESIDASRAEILAIADIVVPGHGAPFEVGA